MLKHIFSFLLVLMVFNSYAQQMDSLTNNNKDTISVKDAAKEIGFREKTRNLTREIGSLFKDTTALQPARKAVLRSAIIPGWGQARNHKWWKVPLVYGGFVGLGLVYNFNDNYYKEFLKESQFRKANQELPLDDRYVYIQYKGISDDQIYAAKDFYRRNRDLTLYSMVGFWGLQMIDAYIDARLATFDVSDDLSLKITPSIYIPSYASVSYQTAMPMLTLKLNLK